MVKQIAFTNCEYNDSEFCDLYIFRKYSESEYNDDSYGEIIKVIGHTKLNLIDLIKQVDIELMHYKLDKFGSYDELEEYDIGLYKDFDNNYLNIDIFD